MDSIILQLFHTGNSSDDLSLLGTIKSVRTIKRKEIFYSIIPIILIKALSRESLNIKRKTMRRIFGWSIMIVGISFSIAGVILPSNSHPLNESPSLISRTLIGIPYFWLVYKSLKRHIPKGFDIFNEEF